MSWLTRTFNKVAAAPKTPKVNVRENFHGQVVRDPYRHLENLNDPKTLSWAHAQTDRFHDFVRDYPRRKEMESFLHKVWDYPSNAIPERCGNKWIKSYNSGLENQSRLMIADDIDGPWKTLLDPNTLSKDGTVALKSYNIDRKGEKMIYLLSEDGSDEETLYVMDLASGKTLEQDIIKGCRFTATSWDRDGKGFNYRYPANDGKQNMVIKHHTLGKDAAQDKVIYQRQDWKEGFPWISRGGKGDQYDWLGEDVGTNATNALSYRKKGSDDPFTLLFKDGVASYDVIDEINGKVLMQTDYQAPKGQAVLFDPAHPEPENWTTLLPEHPQDKLQYLFEHQGKIYAGYSHDAADQVRIFDLKGTPLGEIPLPPQTTVGFGAIRESEDHFLLKISGFQSPGSIYRYDTKAGTLDELYPSKIKADLKDCIVERIRATSKDGTEVPMTVVRRKDVALDGTAATKLYGYGGFNVSLEPGFGMSVMNWVREGGVYVQANLRGGGEFGREWCEQGKRDKKQNVFDDFIACAEHLIAKNYTAASRLVIEGGSNGGLLTAATVLQRPDLFGAVISDVPVTDMLRFHKHTYGSYWKSDYGDPENKPEDFKASMGYSPLHNVRKNAKYPPILVQTADHDDRVVPSHAYKFVATLQARASNDNLVMLNVEKNAGHGAGKPTSKIIKEMVDSFAFVEKTIGPVDQNAYKLALHKAHNQGRHIPRRLSHGGPS